MGKLGPVATIEMGLPAVGQKALDAEAQTKGQGEGHDKARRPKHDLCRLARGGHPFRCWLLCWSGMARDQRWACTGGLLSLGGGLVLSLGQLGRLSGALSHALLPLSFLKIVLP